MANWPAKASKLVFPQTVKGTWMMQLFRLYLAVLFVSLFVYTGFVVANHGFAYMPVFFGDFAAMTWPGHFNADLMCMLGIGSIWTAWRHEFTPFGFLMGAGTLFGGALFLTIYLIVVAGNAKGDPARLLLGNERQAKRPDS